MLAQNGITTDPGQQNFNGSFVEYSIRSGLSSLKHNEINDAWALDAGIRHSFPMYLGDTRLAYRYDKMSGDNTKISLHGIGLTFGIHPFYLALLSNNLLGHFLASLHGELGVSAQYAVFERTFPDPQPANDLKHTDIGLAWSLGAGFDLPLWNPNHGHSPWLNVNYRYKTGKLDLPQDENISLSGHTIFVGLSWRVNGLIL